MKEEPSDSFFFERVNVQTVSRTKIYRDQIQFYLLNTNILNNVITLKSNIFIIKIHIFKITIKIQLFQCA